MTAPVGQTWLESLIEAGIGLFTAIALSVLVQRALFPALGITVPPRDTLIIAVVFSSQSALRNLVLRRVFNGLSLRDTSLPQTEAP